MTDGVWKGLANQYMVRKRPDDWYEDRDEQEIRIAEAGDKLVAEFDMHEGFVSGAGVSFQIPKFTGAVDVSGAPKNGNSHDPDYGLLLLSADGAEYVTAAHAGAMWFSRRCLAKAAAFFDPAVQAPDEEELPYRPEGASVAQLTKDAVGDFDELVARAEAGKKPDVDALRAHYDRKRTYTFMIVARGQNTSVTVDGRSLVHDVYLQRDQKLGQKLGWALRKAGLDAQAYCAQTLDPLMARVPSLGDIVPGFGEGMSLNLVYEVADWPAINDYEVMKEREEFLHEVRLFRFSPWDVEKKQIERAKAAWIEKQQREAGL